MPPTLSQELKRHFLFMGRRIPTICTHLHLNPYTSTICITTSNSKWSFTYFIISVIRYNSLLRLMSYIHAKSFLWNSEKISNSSCFVRATLYGSRRFLALFYSCVFASRSPWYTLFCFTNTLLNTWYSQFSLARLSLHLHELPGLADPHG